MNLQFKPTFIIVLTLVLGFMGGLLTFRAVLRGAPMRDGRFEHGPGFEKREGRDRAPEAFQERMEKILNITPAQKKTMDPILEKYLKKFSEKMEQHQQEISLLRDSLKAEMGPILTEEQKKRLNREDARMEEMRKHLDDPKGRPPMPPPMGCPVPPPLPPEGRP